MVKGEVVGLNKTKKDIENALKDFIDNRKMLKVGFFESAKYDDGTPVAQVAFWQEYGTLKIPMRPFMRNALTKNRKKWLSFFKRQAMNTLDLEKSLKQTGEIMRGDIVLSITQTNNPPNSPSTIKSKGSSNPLIDTGLMRSSVSYKVVKNG